MISIDSADLQEFKEIILEALLAMEERINKKFDELDKKFKEKSDD